MAAGPRSGGTADSSFILATTCQVAPGWSMFCWFRPRTAATACWYVKSSQGAGSRARARRLGTSSGVTVPSHRPPDRRHQIPGHLRLLLRGLLPACHGCISRAQQGADTPARLTQPWHMIRVHRHPGSNLTPIGRWSKTPPVGNSAGHLRRRIGLTSSGVRVSLYRNRPAGAQALRCGNSQHGDFWRSWRWGPWRAGWAVRPMSPGSSHGAIAPCSPSRRRPSLGAPSSRIA